MNQEMDKSSVEDNGDGKASSFHHKAEVQQQNSFSLVEFLSLPPPPELELDIHPALRGQQAGAVEKDGTEESKRLSSASNITIR